MFRNVFIYFMLLFCIFCVLGTIPVESSSMYQRSECEREGDNCIDIYKCPYFMRLLKEIKRTRPHFVIREIRTNQCGYMENRPKVCCTPNPNNETREIEGKSEIQHENLKLLPTRTCGKVRMHSRITNGKPSLLGEFPWMAMLFYTTSNGSDFLCGGSLISEKYVLTAAHCINDNILGVRVGEYNIFTSKDCERRSSVCAPPYQDFHIETIIMHQEYNRKSQANDIAIIRLSQPADLKSDYVGPICLPLWNGTTPEEGKMTVAGWGITEKGYRSPILNKADIPVVPLATCRKIFNHYAELHESHICAGGEKKDSCNGDSGGPLFHISAESGTAKYVQTGIVSFGAKSCGTFGLPGIYTKVQSYIYWILDHLEP